MLIATAVVGAGVPLGFSDDCWPGELELEAGESDEVGVPDDEASICAVLGVLLITLNTDIDELRFVIV